MITQSDLQRYLDLQESENERKELRLSLLAMLDREADIEPGQLVVSASQYERTRIGREIISDILGKAVCNRLYQTAPKYTITNLYVSTP